MEIYFCNDDVYKLFIGIFVMVIGGMGDIFVGMIISFVG